MVLQCGLPLLFQQYKALLKKNSILARRNRLSTIGQLLCPFVVVSLLFTIQYALKPHDVKPLYDPQSLISPPIPPCEDKFYIKTPCFDFAWSGNQTASVAAIVSRIMANNPGRPIPLSKVKSFTTKKEVDEWLFNDPMHCPGALHFEMKNDSVVSYGVQTNSTQIPKQSDQWEDPTFKFQIPLQLAAEREIARFLIGDSNHSWVVGLKEFPHPALGTSAGHHGKEAEQANILMQLAGPVLFLVIAMFQFICLFSSLVTEKEHNLRQAMSMMGLYDTAYWLSWLTWEAILALLITLDTVLWGFVFRFPLFLRNSFAIVFLLIFLFQLSMIGFASMLSTVIGKSYSAIIVGSIIFVVSFVAQMVAHFQKFPYSSVYPVGYRMMWSIFPPNLLTEGIRLLSDATAHTTSVGLRWNDRSICMQPKCAITINGILIGLLVAFLLWFTMALFLDNILLNSSCVRKSIFYFLKPGYWTGKGVNEVVEGGIFTYLHPTPSVDHKTPDDADVLQEQNYVQRQVNEGVVDPNVVIQLRGLVKTYPKRTDIGCCTLKMKPHYHAVKGLWMDILQDELFCILGPNGAGKTTSVSCLTGITPITSGDALIYGHSVRSSVGLSNIRKFMGVCPQYDIFWDALSGEEHLHLFASIKGFAAASIKLVAQKSLAKVRLTEAAKRRASSYSGAMKRCLSIAIALLGEPELIILDEPTSGMDPISRMHVWDIITEAKKGRVVVLTTHSMDEADILSDRIAIMAKGMLQCIGTSLRLKSKFGSGLVTNVSFSKVSTAPEDDATAKSRREALKDFFKHRLKELPKEETGDFLSYVISREGIVLRNFFDGLQLRKRVFGIDSIQISLPTLEEVFVTVAKKAALENADDDDFVSLNLESGTSLLVRVGLKYIGIPGTESQLNPRGLMVEASWGHDSCGNLCISGQSIERRVPDNARSVPRTPPRRLGHKGPLYGIELVL